MWGQRILECGDSELQRLPIMWINVVENSIHVAFRGQQGELTSRTQAGKMHVRSFVSTKRYSKEELDLLSRTVQKDLLQTELGQVWTQVGQWTCEKVASAAEFERERPLEDIERWKNFILCTSNYKSINELFVSLNTDHINSKQCEDSSESLCLKRKLDEISASEDYPHSKSVNARDISKLYWPLYGGKAGPRTLFTFLYEF